MTPEKAKKLLPIIQAYAEGKPVEFFSKYHACWMPVLNPTFVSDYKWRVAPEKKWYRVALCTTYTSTADTEEEEKTYEECGNFIRWLTPRMEYSDEQNTN